jgi:hypothetical protein
MKPKLLSHLNDLNRELKITAQEMRLVSRQINTECWQSDPEQAYHFPALTSKFRQEAYEYLNLLEEEGYTRLFVTIHDDAYVIMRVVGAGAIHYYTEPKGYLHEENAV